MRTGSTTTPGALDARMWRKLKARCHPDIGGSDDLFVWIDIVEERLTGLISLEDSLTSMVEPEPEPEPEPAPPPPPTWNYVERFILDVERIHRHAGRIHRDALFPLVEWWDRWGRYDESSLASKPMVCKIAHLVGMTYDERVAFYRVCDEFELSKDAAGYLIGWFLNAENDEDW